MANGTLILLELVDGRTVGVNPAYVAHAVADDENVLLVAMADGTTYRVNDDDDAEQLYRRRSE